MIKQIIEKNEKISVNIKEIEFIKEKFPSCFDINGDFDIEKFKEILKDKINITNEGYELKFLGKNYARLLASLDTTTVIEPDITHNEKNENKNSENIYISGDNLDGLKHLLNSYSQKIKVVYIDPPYNTGSDGFIYNDNYNFNANDLMEKLNISEDEANKILKFTKKGTASHSAWLMFMYPRILLARDLLSDDGVIFISIDDNEQANLKLMCDEIFGEENFLGELIIKTATDNNPSQIDIEHEYMIGYAKNKEIQSKWYRRSESADKIQNHYEYLKEKYKNEKDIQEKLREWINKNKENLSKQVLHYNNVDEKGVFSSSSNSANPHPGGYMYDIIHPVDNLPCPKPSNGWRWPEETFLNYKNQNEVIWGKDHSTQPHIIKRLETSTEQLKSFIYEDNRGETSFLKNIFDNKKVFDNPKPHNVIARLLEFIVDDGDIVIDFFSGSGTTGHSVLQGGINKNIKLKYILVQLPENLDDNYEKSQGEAKTTLKNAIELCDKCNYPHTLDYIGIERLKRVAKKIKEEYPDKELDLGFKHFILKEVNEDTFDKIEEFVIDDTRLTTISNLIDDFGKDVVLTTWLNKDGYGLTNKNEPMYKTIKFADYEAYYRDKHLYIINKNLSDDAIKAMVEKYELDGSFNPENIVIFGYSLGYIEMENLKNNLVRVKDSAKNLNINFDIRY